MKSGRGFLILFRLFWSSLVLLFDGFIFTSIVRQVRAEKFPSTVGQVVSSQVTRHRGSKGGTSYGVKIRYQYVVDDRAFQAGRYRYGQVSSSNRSWAKATVARFPPGSQTRVFYNPANPSDALLSPGIDGSDLFFLLILTPFNGVMFVIWSGVFLWIRQKYFQPAAGGAKIIEEPPVVRVRLPSWTPGYSALVALGIAAFVAMFVIALGYGGQASMSVMQAIWLLTLAVAGAAYAWRWTRIRSGNEDLILDQARGAIDLPMTLGRKSRVTIAVSDIESVGVQRIQPRGRRSSGMPTYAPTIYLRPRPAHHLKLVEWYDSGRAESLAAWLRAQLNLPEPEPLGTNSGWSRRTAAPPNG
jgi:hypothetical protein